MKLFTALALVLLTTQVQAATLIVSSTPSGAEVLLDKESVGRTPFRKWVSPGNYALVLKKDNYKELSQRIEVGRKMVILRLKLEPKTYPVDILFKSMNKDTMDWHVFANDGTHLGIAPGTFEFPKGKVRVLLVKEGFKDVPVVTEVTGEPQVVTLEDPKRGKSSWSRLCTLRFAGVWQRVIELNRLVLRADMTFVYEGKDQPGWSGTWTANEDSFTIEAYGRPLVLTIQEDGCATGRAHNGHDWKIRKVGDVREAERLYHKLR